ncbi:MAG: DUF2520 domain-containing protein [candidate division KSB1 bacterium]|nr:DUF2520 domain-containing protein [candidate division KSB1 bacterium]
MSRQEQKVVLIGAGRVGSTLAVHLREKGYTICAVISRSRASASACAEKVQCPLAATDIQELPSAASIILITTPDDAIPSVVQSLVKLDPTLLKDRLVAHTSGALSSSILAPLKKEGALVASIHPVQTFPPVGNRIAHLTGVYFGIEGNDQAIKKARKLVEDLGGIPIVLPEEVKGLYHLACTMASNYLVTLIGASLTILRSLNLSEKEAFCLLKPLLEGTLKNIENSGVSKALTGPIARGDVETVRLHLTLLEEKYPDLLPLYLSLGTKAMEISLAQGKIELNQIQKLIELWSQKIS